MEERYIRESLIIGDDGVKKLNKSKIAIFGVGGVGSFAAEALARAGIGTIALVDGDVVAKSNLNRQLIALEDTIGSRKVDVMEKRIKSINEGIDVIPYFEFYSKDNYRFINISDYDFIIDAIDSVPSKILLITEAEKLDIPIISCMGTGNRLDPTAFIITDLFKTEGCPLARKMRYELKKKGVNRLPVVFSKETPVRHKDVDDNDTTIGSISFVPSCAGMIAAGYAIKMLLGM